LVQVITDHGGEVIANDGVQWIEVNDRKVNFVRTRSGKVWQADIIYQTSIPAACSR
jgi:all-trans-retinol 13,14-reductase